MNSGLQCLIHTQEIVEDVLSNAYLEDINTENPIGSKGELIKKFANLIKKMWCQSKTPINPFNFKKAMSRF